MIRLESICKSYGDNKVLEDINLAFAPGLTCLMGPSGIGKTTLANIIAGLLPADSGEISGLDGKKISMVFQEDRLLEWETAITNLLFVMKKGTGKDNRNRARLLLTQAGLAGSLEKKAAELSGGMKRRVCLCRALVAEYDVLILDEPFKGLDSGIKPSVMAMVLEYACANPDKTVICITHDPLEAEYLGGRVEVLYTFA